MSTRAEILRQIEALAAAKLDWRGELSESSRLAEDLALDSLRAMSLIIEIENHFRISLEPTDEEGVETVGDLVSIVAQLKSGEG